MASLGVLDTIIVIMMLLLSSGMGVYFRFSGGKQKTTEEYLLAGRNMPVLPVAFSIMASFMSSMQMMGMPAEVYLFGIQIACMDLGFFLGAFATSYILVPVFFDMQASSAYEYLERRFGVLTRTLTSSSFTFQIVLYTAIVLYTPALALTAMTNLSMFASVCTIGLVCTFYSSLGGMKAVLWTDAFQSVLMFLGIFAVLIKGFIDVGGVQVAFQRAYEAGRLKVPGFEFDLEVRYTWWNLIITSFIMSMFSYGSNQIQIQRLLTVNSLARSRMALYIGVFLSALFKLLNCFGGLVIFAYYYNCDPVTSPSKSIESPDQLLPLFVTSSLSDYPGVAGLCVSGIFSASLSTVSSSLNSLVVMTTQDILMKFSRFKNLSEKKSLLIAKLICIFYGVLCIMLAFVVGSFGYLVQATVTITGLMVGPVLAIYLLGVLTQTANEKGVVTGLILSLSFTAWISFGAMFSGASSPPLPVSTEGCPPLNASSSSPLNITSLSLKKTFRIPRSRNLFKRNKRTSS